jgi:hypothetical protein
MSTFVDLPSCGGCSGESGVISLNGLMGTIDLIAGTGISITTLGQNITISNTESGGSVTSVSVVTVNGFAGTVANPTTTPAITLETTITGILQGNGTAISAASTLGSGSIVLSSVPTNGELLIGSTSDGYYVPATLTAGAGISITNGSGSITITNTEPSSGGTVTSVGLSTPGVLYSVSSSPITTSGNIALNLISQSANTVLAGPTSGAAANPSFRALVSADIPNNAANTTGTASNITATSNSTLTTLPALTTASSLSSVGTITSGVWNGTPTAGNVWITSGTTYTTPATITTSTAFKITLIGAGAAGGGNTAVNSASGTGGGGGEVVILLFSGLSPSTAYTIAVGAGGVGASGANGGSGGNTSFDLGGPFTITAHGGTGGNVGTGTTGVGGAGGTGGNGTINITGAAGGYNAPNYDAGGAAGMFATLVQSPLRPASGSTTGNAATGYGGGGTGSVAAASGATAGTGGAGSQGAILIEWNN